MVSWAFARVGVHRLFPSLSITRSFSTHFSSPANGFHSYFFYTTDASAPIGRPFTYSPYSPSFQAWDWRWYPMLLSQRQSKGAHETKTSVQISAMAGVRNSRPYSAEGHRLYLDQSNES